MLKIHSKIGLQKEDDLGWEMAQWAKCFLWEQEG